MAKAFALILQDLRDGRTHDEMSQQFDQLIAQVQASGKSGTLTLTIKVAPASRAQPVDKVIVQPVVKLNPPKPEVGEDFFWVTDDAELSRNHPKQAALDLREATSNSKPEQFKEATK